uniref:Tryptophan synthase alpha chain n=1 Tax=Hommersandiophycus borowitzkae TaxID=268573 RepID=A0A1G4NTU4_9FLOR|nr:Tryptophan synthase alpha subunit [Hommersandiophycus borowitzkae]SCW22111.1 Tryptophan synthase alpha subunit [Hommersandiophycus borowitzkae]
MARVSSTLSSLQKRCGLIPFITAGSPNIEGTEQALKILDKSGADIIEIGLPYSDPLADGPIIQGASNEALKHGMNFDILLELLHNVRDSLQTPLVLFTYYNPIIARGILPFVEAIAEAGIQGLIVPDLPLEEADYMLDICHSLSIELILLITPTSSIKRINSIIEKSQGVIYIVSSTGVTGMRESINQDMQTFISTIRSRTDKLLIIGFGISNLKHVQQIMNWDIDGIVIGSAFVNRLSNPDLNCGLNDMEHFCLSVNQTLNT